MRTQRSQEFFNQAKDVLVGGVNSPVRSFKSVGGQPLVMKYGRRSQLFDQDNNAYTDYCLSWGALILGHAYRNVEFAVKKTLERGTSFGTTTRDEIELAQHIVKSVPSIELIRFVNSGTEATMSAIRLARGFTKREIVIKFDGCYHGHFDDLLVQAGSGVAALKASTSLGITKGHLETTISLPYNDTAALEKKLSTLRDEIACVIIEPVAGNMGVIVPDINFLKTLRALTTKYKIVLIFDEVMTGFRTNAGCVQADFNIFPDLTCLGKIIGGGFPIGAYGGRRDIMQCLAPLGGVYQAGTFAGSPVVMRAGLTTLKLLGPNFYKYLNAKSVELANRINSYFKENKIQAHLSHYYSMMSIRFRETPVLNYADAQAAAGGEKYSELFWYLLDRGIYWPPADLEAFFISSVHTKKDLDQLVQALQNHFKPKIAKERI